MYGYKLTTLQATKWVSMKYTWNKGKLTRNWAVGSWFTVTCNWPKWVRAISSVRRYGRDTDVIKVKIKAQSRKKTPRK